MSFTLFEPANKVQKDKQIIKEIDGEVAAFGRTSLILSAMGFGVYLLFGSLWALAPKVCMALGISLALISAFEAYLLVAFDSLYARGCSRWRNRFLAACLCQSAWLGIFLGSITVLVNLDIEVVLAWLLAVVYLLMAIGALAPYQRYAQIFVAITIIPGVLCFLSQVTANHFILAFVFTAVLILLLHQIAKFGRNFWRFHEADFLLHQKMNTLEAQKKDNDARVELNYEFVANLGQELKTTLNDILGGITLLQDSNLPDEQLDLLTMTEKAGERQLELVENIVDFAKISKRSLIIENQVFSLRRELEQVLADATKEAHEYNVELTYLIQDDLPYRAKGDNARLRQIITSLVSNMIRFSEGGDIFVEVRTEELTSDSNLLIVDIYDEGNANQSRDTSTLFNAFARIKHTKAGTGLGLAICKGIAECMGGVIGADENVAKGRHFWLKLPLEIKPLHGHYFVPNSKLVGKKLLLVKPPFRIRSHLAKEFSSWGLDVHECEGYRHVKGKLLEAIANDEPFAALLGFTLLSDNSLIHTFQRIAEHPQLGGLHQFIVASELQFQRPDWSDILGRLPQLCTVCKPLNYKIFHQLLVQRLLNVDLTFKKRSHQPPENHFESNGSCKILLVEDHRVNQLVAEGMLKKLGYQPQLAKNGLEALDLIAKEKFDLVLMDCQMAEMDGYQATQEIRLREQHRDDDIHIPIIALTANTAEEDQSRCLAAGMDDYLAKPVRYLDLESRLRRWLGDQPAQQHH